MSEKIRILSTSDIHGAIFPYSYGDMKEMNMGLAKIKTLIDSLRNENTIIIDNGDTIEGSPFTFYHYSQKKDEVCPLSLAMRKIGYDYLNVGNHDFNYGKEVLDRHIEAAGGQLLTANLLYKGKQVGKDYVIHTFNNKKLAIFALTTQYIPHWEDPKNIEGFEFPDAYETAKRIVKKIKEKENPDYIVGVYHGGFEKDPKSGAPCADDTGENEGYRMIEEIEGIDVLISGHQHRISSGKLFNTYYTHPFEHGFYLSVVEIDTDTDEISAEIVQPNVEADRSIIELCQKEEDEVQKWLDTSLGTTDVPMLIVDEFDSRFNKSQLVTFINRVQMQATDADLAAAAIFYGALGLSRNITMRSLVNTYLYPNTLYVKKLNGKILKEYLEQCADFWSVRGDEIIINPLYDFPTPGFHNYEMVDGVEYTIKASNPYGSKIIELTRNGIPVKDNDEFTMAVNSYRATGVGGFNMIKDAPTVREVQKDIMDLLAEYIMKNRIISFEPVNNIKIIY